MSSILKISEAAALAFHACVIIASTDEKISTSQIAEKLKASEAHLAKVMQRLAKGGIVNSTRGPKGGFELTDKTSKISLMTIYEAIEGPFPSDSCLFGTPVCGRKKCPLGKFLKDINSKTMSYFKKTKISDLI